MIMLRLVVNSENDGDLGIKIFLIETGEVGFSVEDQPVSAAQEWLFNQKKGLDPAIVVSPCMAKFGPTLVRILPLEPHCYATRRCSARDIKDVRRNRAHAMVRSLQSAVSESTKIYGERVCARTPLHTDVARGSKNSEPGAVATGYGGKLLGSLQSRGI